MSDAETRHIVELQTQLADKLAQLGFADDPRARDLVSYLADIAARCRTFEQQSMPLFQGLSADHRRAFAQLVLEIKSDLDALQDSIRDVQPSLQSLLDYLIREIE